MQGAGLDDPGGPFQLCDSPEAYLGWLMKYKFSDQNHPELFDKDRVKGHKQHKDSNKTF